jgi:hypothetical protein
LSKIFIDEEVFVEAYRFGEQLALPVEELDAEAGPDNPLEAYFDGRTSGRGIWKWAHYFEIYHRHFKKFVGREVHVVEIGVFGGGSLDMWRDYFGPDCHLYGVDKNPACRADEDDSIRIFIGDQGDRGFWRDFIREVPRIDIVVDDGSHRPHDQIATLEALLPQIRPGGVYLCEDAPGVKNPFHSYIDGLSRNLHAWPPRPAGSERTPRPPGADWSRPPSDFQRAIQSIHLYPFVTVIEKRSKPLSELRSSMHGTEWLLRPAERAAAKGRNEHY